MPASTRPIRRWLLWLALALLAPAARAEPVTRLTNIGEFRPTQMEIGRDAVTYHIDKWKKDAAQRGMSFAAYARDVLRPKFQAQQINSVIDPEGHIRNTDAHHRISALRRVSAETGVPFEINARILADYRGKSQGEYAEHFLNTLKKGQFTVAAERLPPAARMQQLPVTYAGLGNNALRSSLEIVFGTHGIDGGWMRDYVEFRIARRLMADGILDELKAAGVVPADARKVPVRVASDPRVIAAVARRLPELEAYLVSEANDAASASVLSERLAAMRAR